MQVYTKKIRHFTNPWIDHTLVRITFHTDSIRIESWDKVPDEKKEEFEEAFPEICLERVADILGDSSRADYAYALRPLEYTLDQFREHPQFKDLSAFGIGGARGSVCYANIDPGKQVHTSFGDLHMVNGYPFTLIFPDTESTFDDAVILLPNFLDGSMELHHNGDVQGEIYFTPGSHPWNRPPVMDMTFPGMTLSGPEEVEAGGEVTMTLHCTDSPLGLGSMYRVHLACDNGFLPRRTFSMDADSTVTFTLSTAGLEAGDMVSVSAGVDACKSLACLKVRLI